MEIWSGSSGSAARSPGGLGDEARAAHEDVGRHAVGLHLDQLIAVGGEEAGWLQQAARAAGAKAMHLPDQHTALHLLRSTLRAGDLVLVRASRGVRLQQLAEALLQPDPEPAGGAGSPKRTDHPPTLLAPATGPWS
ncbi:hypothetical protein [Streptomyces sp. NPDC003710]